MSQLETLIWYGVACPGQTGPTPSQNVPSLLRGFSGLDKLGSAQIDALLASATDGPGMAATEQRDLSNLYSKHASLLEVDARVKLGAALGISGLEDAPLGTTPISMRNDSFTGRASLDFRKDPEGTMAVRLRPASIRDYGWVPVKPDGSFELTDRVTNLAGKEAEDFTFKGKVRFESGAFIADASFQEVHHRTRPQGSGDASNWNSGNRVPYTNTYKDSFRTENHPSLTGTRIYNADLKRGGPYRNGPTHEAALLNTPDGTFLQLADSAPYNTRVPVGADGKISSGIYTGQVSADGRIELTATQKLSANYTESVSWAGQASGFTPS